MAFSLAELAVRFGCTVNGDPETRVHRVGTLVEAGGDAITFLANPRYRKQLAATRAAAAIVGPDDAGGCPVPALVSDNPYALYARVAAVLHPEPDWNPGVHPNAYVDPEAAVAATAWVGPMAVVEAGATLAGGVYVGPGCVVGAGATVGEGSKLLANVTLCHGVTLGKRCIVHPGAVIGGDGFGIAKTDEGWLNVPQVGSVRIGDDVDIGCSTTVDRGAIEDTVIEDGVKLDNQIQVGHNVRIGEHTVMAACSGVSGSTVIGKRCMIAGAVGFVGHLTIADDVVFTGQTMVNRSVREPGAYSSALPMDDAVRWRKNAARFKNLDTLARKVKELEERIASLDRENGDNE